MKITVRLNEVEQQNSWDLARCNEVGLTTPSCLDFLIYW